MLTAKPNQLNQVFNVVSVLHQSQVAENSFDPQKCFKNGGVQTGTVMGKLDKHPYF